MHLKCADLVEMHVTAMAKKTAQKCQCLKIRLQYLQSLRRWGLSIGENDDGSNNFTQLLLLCGKNQPFATERVTSGVPGIKKYNNSFSGKFFELGFTPCKAEQIKGLKHTENLV